jgi:hypothetical protein
MRGAVQRELDDFIKAINQDELTLRKVTKSAFTQARAKLNEWAFIRLNEVVVKTFYEAAEFYTWFGFRVLSADGSRLALPNHPSIIKEFGQQKVGPHADSPRSMAMISALYDVLNQITIDAQIASYSRSEAALLKEHLKKVEPGDLLLLDRGYPSFWLFFLLTARKIDFCIRMKANWWLTVKEFSESDDTERLVNFSLPKKDREKLKDFPHMQDAEITCRLIKIDLGNGTNEILCTSLIDSEKYAHKEFDSLYHYRWNEEEAYKLLKSRIELENFSGKTAKAIKQDFYAKVFLTTLCAAYAHPVEERVRAEFKADENRKHDQKINRTNALRATMDILIPMFVRKKITKVFEAFDQIVYKTREIIRPDRHEPRKFSPKKPYSMNYKRL